MVTPTYSLPEQIFVIQQANIIMKAQEIESLNLEGHVTLDPFLQSSMYFVYKQGTKTMMKEDNKKINKQLLISSRYCAMFVWW